MRSTISVVMPFFRDDRWFPEALASVLGVEAAYTSLKSSEWVPVAAAPHLQAVAAKAAGAKAGRRR